MIKRDFKPSFGELFDTLLPYVTPLNRKSLELIYQYALMANKVDGVAAEAGVYTGTSLYILAKVFDGEIHAFDSFQGIPALTDEDKDILQKGQFSYPLHMVKKRLHFTNRIVYYEGFFSDTFPTVDRAIRFSYVFCDVDLYQSTLECFRFFYPKMNPGGVLILDDYFCNHTPGSRAAIDEMIADYEITEVYQEGCFVVIEV